MQSLTKDPDEKAALLRLINGMGPEGLNGTNAWSCFSSPSDSYDFRKQGVYNFTPLEKTSFFSLKKKLVSHLLEKSRGACAYCKRPVGRYGFSWHIEHVYPKSHFPERTFLLSNLVVGCVDCNKWKAARVDRQSRSGLSIIDPSRPDFIYSNYLNFVSICTEYMAFIKYLPKDDAGLATWEKLNFAEIERATLIDSLNPRIERLHQRINQAACEKLGDAEGGELVELLYQLKGKIYDPKRTTDVT